ncbi:ESX secretion-associated protein EspG [Crossiella sp. SN42]|uniref:ESX secretion-associated protein EspG n=1 Tax=Crossiella sp. SN42 TaxID=2944808 RepID=UPI00207D2105|nr:ESX secretion-associated protein EspG [Crossiella sp. SN42]MCO1577805.1 ESX secretion-associated protein EspG [Crossiella sp. SN42]
MLRSAVTLSALAYDLVWEAEEIGDKHNALLTPSPGATMAERLELGRPAIEELMRAGLFDGRQVHPDLKAAMHLIVRAHRELYGWFTPEPDAPTQSVLAVASGRDALLAVLTGEQLHLQPIDARELPSAVAGVLPEAQPLRIPTYSVPLEDLNGGGRGQSGEGYLETAGSAAGRSAELARVRRLFAEPRLGAGQFRAAGRDRHGRRQVTPSPVDYYDVAGGRYVTYLPSRGDGVGWGVVAPGGRAQLVERFTELVASTPN